MVPLGKYSLLYDSHFMTTISRNELWSTYKCSDDFMGNGIRTHGLCAIIWETVSTTAEFL